MKWYESILANLRKVFGNDEMTEQEIDQELAEMESADDFKAAIREDVEGEFHEQIEELQAENATLKSALAETERQLAAAQSKIIEQENTINTLGGEPDGDIAAAEAVQVEVKTKPKAWENNPVNIKARRMAARFRAGKE